MNDASDTAGEGLAHLFDGHARFRRTTWRAQRRRFRDIGRSGQAPRSLVIACCDSRVAPEVIFDAAPGELFVVRSIANLVPPYAPDGGNHGTSAALEYAVTVLGVQEVVVLGHTRCGGIQALLDGPVEGRGDFVGAWMAIAAPARARALAAGGEGEAVARACERESIRGSIENLLTFPWIAAAVAAGTLRLAGICFDVDHGSLTAVG